MPRPVVIARDLQKRFQQRTQSVAALNEVSFDIEQGDFTVILGPSGSGKSTLLTLLGGLQRANKGELVIDGYPLHQMEESDLTTFRREHLGFVFQYFNLLPTLSAAGNVALPLRLLPMSPAERDAKVNEMLNLVGLSHRVNHKPSALSGGEQQRVAVARALVHRPAIVLADEPTGNLDSTSGKMIKELLSKCNRELGQTLVIVSHDASFAELANRVIYMSDGKIDRVEVKARGTA